MQFCTVLQLLSRHLIQRFSCAVFPLYGHLKKFEILVTKV